MPDMDTGVLFEKYSVEEIREIEKKTRLGHRVLYNNSKIK